MNISIVTKYYGRKCILNCLLAFSTHLCTAQNNIIQAVNPSLPGWPCQWPPQHSMPVACALVFVSQTREANWPLAGGTIKKHSARIYDGRIITGENDFKKIFKKHSKDVDWNNKRVIILQLRETFWNEERV